MALTDVKCRGTKPGRSRQKLSDGGGLQLWVQPNGRAYGSSSINSKGSKSIALGPYPQVSLVETRARREELKAKLRAGINPAEEKRRLESQEERPRDTFKEVAMEFIDQCRRDNLAAPTMIKTLVWNRRS